MGKFGAAHRRANDCLRALGTRPDFFLQQFGISNNDAKQVIEIMRDAACQLTDSLHLLRLFQSVFGLALFRHVSMQGPGAHDRTVRAQNRKIRDDDGMHRTIGERNIEFPISIVCPGRQGQVLAHENCRQVT